MNLIIKSFQGLRPPSMRGRGFARGRSRVVYDRRVDYRYFKLVK